MERNDLSLFTVISNKKIAKDVFEMVLSGDTSAITAPGQFVNLKLDGFFLRRPISVCDLDGDKLTLVYKVVGEGTKAMSFYERGKTLDLLTGLGNGYDLTLCGKSPLLVGGGCGVPPMYLLAKKLLNLGVSPSAVLGFNAACEFFYADKFAALGIPVHISTADGSVGTKGFVTDVIKTLSGYTHVCACGPEPMLKAIYSVTTVSGQYSFEERMGCGFGACMGCTCQTLSGPKRICIDGPVLKKEEILWTPR